MTTVTSFDINAIRQQFPTLQQQVYGKPLAYLDNGATAQKPQCVIDAINRYYTTENANIHRGVHFLSQQATTLYENTRTKLQAYLNAAHSHEIIFTRGTTESINLVASSFGKAFVKEGDEIIISAMEHHSNIVPWQMLCEDKGAILRVINMDENGVLDYAHFESLLNEKTKLVSIVHISNTLGTINPIAEIITTAHKVGAAVLVDAAQSVQHMRLDVQQLDADFVAFSGHKMFGPTGVGVLYGKEKWLNAMPPYQGGGDMIKDVTFEKTTYNELPHKFEAGTPNISAGIALGASIDFLNELDFEAVHHHEMELLKYATQQLSAIEGLKIYGTSPSKSATISFNLEGCHPFDVGTLLDRMGIAVRTGHHCTQPIMKQFGIPGTVRASFALYSTFDEIDRLTSAVVRTKSMLQ